VTYRIVGRLGRGGMGVVDLAVDDDGHEVALKRLSLHGTPAELAKARARIHREAEVLLKLHHPAIVGLREVYDDGDDLVLVMDHLEGGNLATRVAEGGPLPSAQIRSIADRLLDALAFAHRQGIIHRDIKPANVLFDRDGQAYLVDFGAATHRDATPGLTASEMVVGTPGFMSPEQARGEPATAASDVFSLGATLAFAATGEGPFGTADPRVLMLRAAAGKIEKTPKDLSPDLRRRIEWMLDRDPARRPTAAEVRGGTDGTNPRPAARPSPLRRVARSPQRIALAAAGVLLVLGAIAAVAFGAFDRNGGASPSPTSRPTTTTAPCTDRPYQPCGQSRPAPNTNGTTCLPGFADYDGDTANGCEVEAIVPKDTVLTPENPIRANLVPADAVNSYRRPVEDRFNALGNGTLHVRLRPPKGGIVVLTVSNEDGDELASKTSQGDDEVDIALTEPSAFSDDSTTLIVTVRFPTGAQPTGAPYELTTSGQY
jgi:hypothetical protein